MTGIYKTVEGEFELELRKNGYNFVINTKGTSSLSQIYGLIGVAGKNLELHLSMGLPNILTFTWSHALEEASSRQEILFTESDENLSVSFNFEGNSLIFKLIVGGQQKAKYFLQKS
ncbi:hypothetical protein [Acinetobacter modestus]|uniref:hypothetical protein n=1 Tax=Acinetobacter modestus TaxID=1776740 RepID=UPI00301A8F01